MYNVMTNSRWLGTGVVDPARIGDPAVAVARPRQDEMFAFAGGALSGVQHQA